jgi:hypothetical protein
LNHHGFLGNVDEILIKRLLLPAHLGIAGAEEDALAFLELQLGQLGRLDGFLVLDLDDATGADDGLEGEVVHRTEALEEVPRRVHVRARVRVQVEDRHIADVTLGQRSMRFDHRRRIARPAVHPILERDGDVDPGGLAGGHGGKDGG